MSKALCKHIESKLPNPDRGNLSYSMKLELTKAQLSEMDSGEFELRVRRLEKILFKLGLERFRVNLLIDRFISKLSLKEIAERHGYTDHRMVLRLVNQTLDLIRKFKEPFIQELISPKI